MMKATDPLHAAVAATALLLTMGAAPGAEDVSRWDGDARSAARLIAGSQQTAGVLRAGVEVRLKPGWHTYWRYPGDAGTPPQFDFKGSQNVAQVRELWPAPERIVEAGGSTIGYVRDVMFPLQVVARDAAKPVTLRLKLNYGICEKYCAPADANVELALGTGPASRDVALALAERRVPQKGARGEGGPPARRPGRRPGGPRRPRPPLHVPA